jgi:ABC-type nickel/cobalt efflux system permease component RcnA
MLGLSDVTTPIGTGGLGIIAALLLGLRHATDPDHLTALSSLVLDRRGNGARRAGVLGLAWGVGHAITLTAFGVPVLLFGRHLPDEAHRAAEVAVGVMIVALAVRLLVRWRRGYFHSHVHEHEGVPHVHPHVHDTARSRHGAASHAHPHAESLGRSPVAALGLGLVHGTGGSAGVSVLLVGAMADPRLAVIALLILAVATAASMAAVSAAFGFAITRDAVARRFERLIPIFALGSLMFGVWYAWSAIGFSA